MKLATQLVFLASVLLISSQAHGEKGATSRAAVVEGFTKVLRDWDKDGDGKLSFAEIEAMIDAAFPLKYFASEADARRLRGRALVDYRNQDLSKDGFLTLNELLREPITHFDCMDVDHDDVVQRDEIEAGIQRCDSGTGETGALHDVGIVNPALAEKQVPFGPPKPLNDGDWLLSSDFQGPEFNNFRHGAVHLVLYVSPQGRVSHCTTQASSANAQIDSFICNLIIERARFRPAGDPSKQPVEGTHSRQFAW